VAVFFNKPMEPTTALDPSNYSAVAHGRDGVFGTADDRAIPIASIGRSDDGQVVRQRGGDGIALIRRLEGIDPFGRVRSALRTPPFIDLSQIAPAAVDAILAAQARRPRR
jgi:hypothetical protein